MGFADEVKASQSKNTEQTVSVPPDGGMPNAQESAPTEAKPAGLPDTLTTGTDILNASAVLPSGQNPVDPANAPKPSPEASAPKEDTVPKIRIGGREFTSVEDAMNYATQLELARQADEAFKQGYQTAEDKLTPKEAAIEADLNKIIEEKFFENPAEAIKMLREKVKEDIFADYNKMTADQAKASALEASKKQLWDSFYQDNTDLSDPDTRDYVENHLLKKHWDSLKNLPMEKSLPQLADMARKALRIKREDALPTRELHSGPAIIPGASQAGTSAAPVATSSETLDFVAQVNKLRKRNAK